MLCLGIDDFESGVGEFFLVVQRAGIEERGALCGDKKAGSILLELLICGFGKGDGHTIGGSGAAAFFDEETKAPGSVPLGGELPYVPSGPIGELNHGDRIRIRKQGVKRGGNG